MARRQFVTPPSLPATTVNRCLIIPDSKEWLGIFNSALLELAQAYNYEQVNETDMTPEEVAALCFDIYVQYLEGGCGVDCDDVLACLYPANRLQRMNPTTGRYEVSDDGGQNWQDASDQDPRFSAPRNVQASAFDCDDAKLIVGYVQYVVDEMKAQRDLAASIAGLAAAAVGLLAIVFSFGAALPVAVALGAAMAATTSAAITAALTSAVWERLLCNIHCEIQGATEVTSSMFDAIMAQLATDESGLAYSILWNTLNNLGPVGLHNSVALAQAPTGLPANCDGCGCVDCEDYTENFTGGPGPRTTFNQSSSYNASIGRGAPGCCQSTSGTGIRQADVTVDLGIECTVLNVSLWGRASITQGGGSQQGVIIYYDDTFTQIGTQKIGTLHNLDTTWRQWAHNSTVNGARYVRCIWSTNHATASKRGYLDDITINVQE